MLCLMIFLVFGDRIEVLIFFGVMVFICILCGLKLWVILWVSVDNVVLEVVQVILVNGCIFELVMEVMLIIVFCVVFSLVNSLCVSSVVENRLMLNICSQVVQLVFSILRCLLFLFLGEMLVLFISVWSWLLLSFLWISFRLVLMLGMFFRFRWMWFFLLFVQGYLLVQFCCDVVNIC